MNLRFSCIYGGFVQLCVIAILLATPGFGQVSGQSSTRVEVSIAEVQRQIAQLKAATTPDEATKTAIQELLQQTKHDLESIARWSANTARYLQVSETATTDAARAQRSLKQLQDQPPVAPGPDLSVAEMQERLASLESDVVRLRQAAVAAEEEPNRRAARRKKISQLLAELPQESANLELQLKSPAPSGEAPEMTSARQQFLANHLRAVTVRLEAIRAERLAYDATVDLLPSRRRLAALELERAEQEVVLLRATIGLRQREDVERQLRIAQQALASADNDSRGILEETVRLVQERLDLRGQMEAATRRHNSVVQGLERLKLEQSRVRERIQQVGLTNAVGQLLRRQKVELLPDERTLRSELAQRQDEIQSIQLRMFELEDQQRRIEAQSMSIAIESSNRTASETTGAEGMRLQALDFLLADKQVFFNRLIDLDLTEQELLLVAAEFSQFVDESILWIRGAEMFQPVDLTHAGNALAKLTRLDQWRAVAHTLGEDVQSHPAITLLAATAFVVLIYYNGRASRRVIQLGEHAMRATAQRFGPTLLAFGLTVLSAVPWPAAMANPRAHWADGKPVVAEDVVATWELLTDSTILQPSMQVVYGTFERPVAISKYIVEVRAKSLSWRNLIHFSSMTILPSHEIGGLSGGEYLSRYQFQPVVSSGPYMLRCGDVKKGQSITLRRRNTYWGYREKFAEGLYNFDLIRLVSTEDSVLALEKAKKGELDIFPVGRSKDWAVDLPRLDQVQRGLLVMHRIQNNRPVGADGIVMNTRAAPLDDVRVRKALCHLYNRRKLISKLFYGQYLHLDSYFPKSDFANSGNEVVRYDPDKARHLLREAGWRAFDSDGVLKKEGRRLELELVYSSKSVERYLSIFQEDCAKAGVKIHLKQLTRASRFQMTYGNRRFQLATQGFDASVDPNPQDTWFSTLADQQNNNNLSGIKSPRLDTLCSKYETTLEATERADIMRQIDAEIFQLYPCILGWHSPDIRLLYWNKFGQPTPVIGSTSNPDSVLKSWWMDLAKERQLALAKRDPSQRMSAQSILVQSRQ